MANSRPKLDNTQVGVRSNHDMSFNWMGSADFGRLVPFHWEELLGTDKIITCRPKIEIQMLPLASPTFGKMDLYVHYFLVPIRLLWDDANDFFSQSGPHANVAPPAWTLKNFYDVYNSVFTDSGVRRGLNKHWTSFGLPAFWTDSYYSSDNVNSRRRISTLPFRAYNQVWWDFFRDPELIPDSNISQYLVKTSGLDLADSVSHVHYIPRGRHFNNFWGAQCFANSGQITSQGLSVASSVNPGMTLGSSTSQPIYAATPAGSLDVRVGSSFITGQNSYIAETDSQELRMMEALTRMAERLSLGGKRQIDRLFAQYGIKPEFNKLQMSQYIGGAKSSVLVSDITSSADTQTENYASSLFPGSPLGAKAGTGYCAFNELNIKVECHEPSILLGLFSIMPQQHFVQGINKRWFRNSLDDFFRRELEHVGLVAVRKDEIGANTVGFSSYQHNGDANTYAFTQPYYDYKHHPDILAGDFLQYQNASYSPDESDKDLAYMQSMNLYQMYGTDREFNNINLQIDSKKNNKIFWYQGGNVWQDSDDHFHVNADVQCVINRPMDGFAIPTIESTEVPHAKQVNIGSDVVL